MRHGLGRMLALTVLFAVIGISEVRAHALLTRSSPAGGGTVRSAPAEIVLHFTEPVQAAFSAAEVTGRDEERFDDGPAQIDPNQPTVLRIAVKQLQPGTYTVVWRVLSIDTHVTKGAFHLHGSPMTLPTFA
jgi:methionine-rich copper-binding protein CopC